MLILPGFAFHAPNLRSRPRISTKSYSIHELPAVDSRRVGEAVTFRPPDRRSGGFQTLGGPQMLLNPDLSTASRVVFKLVHFCLPPAQVRT